jgi:ACT domain-containing protein
VAVLNPNNPFQSWILTEVEYLNGSILTITQKQCIQNQIATLSIQLNEMEIDPEHILKTVQEEAGLKGQIIALGHLLTLSASAEAQRSGEPQEN